MTKGRGRLHQINVSAGGVPKTAIPHARVTRLGVEGDRQAHPRIHGGVHRAVCLYSLDLIRLLQAEGHPIVPGAIGENFTVEGLAWEHIVPGQRLTVGEVRLEVTTFTEPCRQVASSFDGGGYRRVDEREYPGWSRVYARVLAEGAVKVGDDVVLENGPAESGPADPPVVLSMAPP